MDRIDGIVLTFVLNALWQVPAAVVVGLAGDRPPSATLAGPAAPRPLAGGPGGGDRAASGRRMAPPSWGPIRGGSNGRSPGRPDR
jgi:hypothetical protein